MDNRLKLIGEKEAGLAYIEIRKLQQKRLELEAVPEPVQTDPYQDVLAEMEKALQAEANQVVANIVATANQNLGGNFSVEGLLEQAKVIYRKEAAKLAVPDMMVKYFQQFRKELVRHVHACDMDMWSGRFKAIDGLIKGWKDKIPVSFSPDLINKNERFPIDRIGMMSNGAYFDRWLTELLKSKPILFSSSEYPDRLVDAYELYKKTFEEEAKIETNRIAKAQKAAEQTPEPPYVEDYRPPAEEMAALRENADFQGDGWARATRGRR